jgi:cell pole-organizing protein PopZ
MSSAPLVSADSEDATRQAIGQLTAALDQSGREAAQSTAATGITIEAMAEAALRPMLKQWLDANLPPLVERLVAREIARITGGRI